jgi:hypothetical protein
MGRPYALILGFILLSHGGVGLFVEGEHILGIFNTDILIDIVYLASAIALLVVGFGHDNAKTMRGVLGVVGLVFVGIGLLGLADDTVSGLLPTGLTGFDLIVLFTAGGGALVSAVAPRTAAPLMSDGVAVIG